MRVILLASISLIILLLCQSCDQSREKVKVDFENVDGLTPQSPVYLNGLLVGKVGSMKVLPDEHILVELNLNQGVLVHDVDRIEIVWIDRLGTKAVEIVPTNEIGNLYTSLDTLRGTLTYGRLIGDSTLYDLDSVGYKFIMDSILHSK